MEETKVYAESPFAVVCPCASMHPTWFSNQDQVYRNHVQQLHTMFPRLMSVVSSHSGLAFSLDHVLCRGLYLMPRLHLVWLRSRRSAELPLLEILLHTLSSTPSQQHW